MKMIKFSVILVLLLFVVGLVGCTSTSSEVKQPSDTASSVAKENVADNSASQVAKKEAADANKDQIIDNGGIEVPSKSLKDILSVTSLKYTVAYTISASGQIMPTTMVMDVPKFAMITKFQDIETRSIFDGDVYTVCTNMGTWSCNKLTVSAPTNVEMEKSVEDGTAKTTYVGTCSVANEAGSKYDVVSDMTVNGAKKSVTSTVCYTADGILLEMTTPDTKMVATKVSRTVDSSMFVPPAAAQDISSMIPPGITIPGQ